MHLPKKESEEPIRLKGVKPRGYVLVLLQNPQLTKFPSKEALKHLRQNTNFMTDFKVAC
jgi:hypothetical protein